MDFSSNNFAMLFLLIDLLIFGVLFPRVTLMLDELLALTFFFALSLGLTLLFNTNAQKPQPRPKWRALQELHRI